MIKYTGKKDKILTGKIGEDAAGKYLKRKGFKIIERNYKNKHGEIDLICKDKDNLVFIEVKTRGSGFGSPEDAVNLLKIRQIIKVSEIYLFLKNIIHSARIDAICVVLDNNFRVKRISHYKEISSFYS